jgi:hypothetical protein
VTFVCLDYITENPVKNKLTRRRKHAITIGAMPIDMHSRNSAQIEVEIAMHRERTEKTNP